MSARSVVWICAVLGALSACKAETTPTEVIVLIDAEARVAERAEQLHVQVQSHDDGKTRIDKTLEPRWPVTLALAPRDGDATRKYRVSAEALDAEGAKVASARLISGYVAGAKLYVVLQLEAACIGHEPACEQDQTCHADVCVDADVDPTRFSDSRERAPVAGDLAGAGPNADGGVADGGATDDGDGAVDQDASVMGDAGDAGEVPDPGIIMMSGDECEEPGARACDGHASTQPLVCRDGAFEPDTPCASDERCDSAPGPTVGTCRPIVDECEDRVPQLAFCAGDTLRSCADLVAFVDEPCQQHATCDVVDAHAVCTCTSGFVASGKQCADVDECETDNGGCDSAAECKNETGSFECGECPAGYTGEGDTGCTPSLLELTVSPGTLDPDFDPDTHEYRIVLPIGVETIAFEPTVPHGTVAAIGNVELAAGAAWTSPPLDLGSNEIELELRHDGREVLYTFEVERGTTIDYIKASNTNASDEFGRSIAISGDTLVVGAPYEDSIATGVNNNTAQGQANNGSADSGAAYVFVHSAGRWKQQAYLKASNTGTDDNFGFPVAIDGDTIVVGAWAESSGFSGVNPNPGQLDDSKSQSGAAYVFVRDAGVWQQQAYLKASNPDAGDGFGAGLAISGDTIAVGANGESSDYDGVNATLAQQNDNSAAMAGAVYVFTRASGTWTQQAYLKAGNSDEGDNFGYLVAIDGDTLVVGAYSESSSIGGVHTTAAGTDNSASGSGAAYVFVRNGTSWQPQAYLKAPDPDDTDLFGASVGISGDTIVIGARAEDSASTGVNDATPGPTDNSVNDSGAAFVFTRSGSTWQQQAYLKASKATSGFGWSVAIVDDTILIGALGDESSATGVHADMPIPADDNLSDSGAAYLFTRDGSTWTQRAFLKADHPEESDEFGFCVALSAEFAVVGSYIENSIATGINNEEPGPADNSALSAGAVYVY